MSQFLIYQCCWCNCGDNAGLHCSAMCCSFWSSKPDSLKEFYPRCYETMLDQVQGIGFNFFCIGFEMCAIPSLVQWSKKLNSMVRETQQQTNSQTSKSIEPSEPIEWSKQVSKEVLGELTCSICLSHDPGLQLECGHLFHRECILKWVGRNKICPLCRSDKIQKSKVFCDKCKQSCYDTTLKQQRSRSMVVQMICDKCQQGSSDL